MLLSVHLATRMLSSLTPARKGWCSASLADGLREWSFWRRYSANERKLASTSPGSICDTLVCSTTSRRSQNSIRALSIPSSRYGYRPSAASTIRTPTAQTSALNEYWSPVMRSGDMYVTVPTHVAQCESRVSRGRLHTPKSASFTSPLRFIRMFPGFTSRWMTRFTLCRYTSASSTCLATPLRTLIGIRWSPRRSTSSSDPASMSSITDENMSWFAQKNTS
mmetsp:Transcript_621/g.1660  ORF Transcript_621/g.1660 Transcript_621/m.1660 type:complete len:221 (-) Transcript_621:688-1350(-)